MNIHDLTRLLDGEEMEILNGTGSILIDFEANMFLAVVNGNSLNLHKTIEEAIEEIKDYNEEEN